jgi:hypothetical protein
LDSAVLADQDRHDRHIRAAFPAIEGSQGGIQQVLGLLGEPIHPFHIAIPNGSFTLIPSCYPDDSDS